MKQVSRILFVSLLFIVAQFAIAQAQFFNNQSLKFNQLFDWVDSYYVDSVNTDKLSEEVIRNMLQKMDPHSSYISKDEVAEMNEPLQGNFEGIGVTFNILNDTIFIVQPLVGGPSEKLGIRAGDRIIYIDTINVTGKGITNKLVFSKLRGKKGTTVNVKIKRNAVNKLLAFSIVRDKIPIQSVDAAYKINDTTGYIRLSRFSITSHEEVDNEIIKLQKENIKNLIIDLSGNGGGYLDVAINLADDFIDENKLIVYTKGARTDKKEYISTSKGLFEKGKLVLIIDEGSASASEILAGAIQDWDRGIIVGRRSYGKGLVQRRLTFLDGAEVRLTVARYYTPSGRTIQKPYTGTYETYSNEVSTRYKNGELLGKEQITHPDSLKYYTLIKKRAVYGGGGISPDIFVPIDTSDNTILLKKLVAKAIINNFALEYADKNRNFFLEKYSNFSNFKSMYIVDDKLVDELVKFAEKQSVTFTAEELAHSKSYIILHLKAFIARDIWGVSEFFEIYNTLNPSYNKAIEVINNWNKGL